MKSSVIDIGAERNRQLNAISLRNAVLCADCDVVSDSPHDQCLVCGSRSLFNISRALGGMLPSKRATLIDTASRPVASPRPVLTFPRRARVRRAPTTDRSSRVQGCLFDQLSAVGR
jgi:hypothetical protein